MTSEREQFTELEVSDESYESYNARVKFFFGCLTIVVVNLIWAITVYGIVAD